MALDILANPDFRGRLLTSRIQFKLFLSSVVYATSMKDTFPDSALDVQVDCHWLTIRPKTYSSG